MKRILKNLLCAIGIIIYFCILVIAYERMDINRLAQDIKVFSGIFLIFGLYFLEKSYKDDNGRTAITSIELMVLAFHSVSIIHITTLIKCDFNIYMFISCGIIGVYYILKSIIIYTNKKREDLKELSDISEILKEDEPIKKEAKKRKLNEEDSKTIKDKNDNEKAEKKKTSNKKDKKHENQNKIEKSIDKDKKPKKTRTKKKQTKKEVDKND